MKFVVRRNGLKGPIIYQGANMDEAISCARECDKYRHLSNDIHDIRILAYHPGGISIVHNWRLVGPFGEEPEEGLIYQGLINEWIPCNKKVSGKRHTT